jgi:hypothetical protein
MLLLLFWQNDARQKKGVKIKFVAPKVKEDALTSFVTLKVMHCFGIKGLEGDQRLISCVISIVIICHCQ